MNKRTNKFLLAGALLAIVIITVIAYFPGMSAGFYFDDEPNFAYAPAMHWTEFSMEALHRTLTEAWAPSRPVAYISFAATHLLSGLDPAPYHWTNLAIHLAVGFALFWVLRLFQRYHVADRASIWIAALVVLVFLIHPLNIQAVTYVVQRMASLSTLFLLLGLGAYISARYQDQNRKRLAWLLVGTAFFALAVGSKELGILLLPLILLYEICFHGPRWIARYHKELTPFEKHSVMTGVLTLLALFAATGWYAFGDSIYWFETMPNRDFSGYERLLTQSRAQLFYLSLLFWPMPSRLNLEHHFLTSHSVLDPPATLLAGAIWLLILVFSLRNATRHPRLAFPILAYFLLHAIESAPINLEMVFEHRMYLPMTMLALLATLNTKPPSRKYIFHGAILTSAMVLFLATATYQRNLVWGNEIAFLRDCAAKSPEKWRPHHNLGTKLGQLGMIDEAKNALEHAALLRPRESETHNQLGNIYRIMNQNLVAEEHYRVAIDADPENAEALYNLSVLLGKDNRHEEQREILEQFIKYAPPYLEKQKRWAIQYVGQ